MGFLIHLYKLDKEERTPQRIIELFLLYQIVFSLGLTSYLSFFGLTFLPKFIADYTGWPESPFEQLLANVNLAFGTLGILSIWLRGHFWTATVLGFSIWILCDGISHIYDSVMNSNYRPGNIGVPLWTDIIVPLILLFLLALHLKYPVKGELHKVPRKI